VEWGEGLWLKCENAQLTGSFKLRGALNKTLGLSDEQLRRGLVAASAGNHGQGVAYAAHLAGAQAMIVVPDDAVRRKVEAIRRLGAEVVEIGGGYPAAEALGRRLAEERRAVWISPYNDADVIAGQGTIGIELLEQLEDLDGPVDVLVPVSGGGLAGGIGLALEGTKFNVFAVQAQNAAFMHAVFHGRRQQDVVETATIADGLSGAVEEGSITFELVRRVVQDVLLVSEEEIVGALRRAWAEKRFPLEPSSGAALAAAWREDFVGRTRVVIVSGGNVAGDLLQRISAGEGPAR
jgi:threonine dehydratase